MILLIVLKVMVTYVTIIIVAMIIISNEGDRQTGQWHWHDGQPYQSEGSSTSTITTIIIITMLTYEVLLQPPL